MSSLLIDATKLKEVREKRRAMQTRMMGRGSVDRGDEYSRRSSEESKKVSNGRQRREEEDRDLARAIKLSEEEEKERLRRLSEDKGTLFDNVYVLQYFTHSGF